MILNQLDLSECICFSAKGVTLVGRGVSEHRPKNLILHRTTTISNVRITPPVLSFLKTRFPHARQLMTCSTTTTITLSVITTTHFTPKIQSLFSISLSYSLSDFIFFYTLLYYISVSSFQGSTNTFIHILYATHHPTIVFFFL